MSDVVIFVVGLAVSGIVLASSIVALIASDRPNQPQAGNYESSHGQRSATAKS